MRGIFLHPLQPCRSKPRSPQSPASDLLLALHTCLTPHPSLLPRDALPQEFNHRVDEETAALDIVPTPSSHCCPATIPGCLIPSWLLRPQSLFLALKPLLGDPSVFQLSWDVLAQGRSRCNTLLDSTRRKGPHGESAWRALSTGSPVFSLRHCPPSLLVHALQNWHRRQPPA